MGSNRRNPYGVYPPATEEYPNGQMKPQKALCYVPDWTTGFAVLTAYRAGTYTQGMEKDFAEINNSQSADKFIQSLLANYNIMEGIKSKSNENLNFKEVFYKLIVLEGVQDAFFDEIVEFVVNGNERKLGRIIEIYEDKAVIQVFEGTENMSLLNTHTKLTGHPMEIDPPGDLCRKRKVGRDKRPIVGDRGDGHHL